MSASPTEYVIMKRGLYYMPNDRGYTGILDNAGVYSEEEALARVSKPDRVTMVAKSKAPAISPACWHDVAEHKIRVLTEQRDALLNACLSALPLVGSHPHESSHKRLLALEAAISKAKALSPAEGEE